MMAVLSKTMLRETGNKFTNTTDINLCVKDTISLGQQDIIYYNDSK